MTERRPHWDAHLIDAISADLREVYENGYSEDQIFRVIAAVEDWLAQTQDDLSLVDIIFAKARAEKAEATIMRIREVCDPDAPMVPTRAVLRALDGADDE